ncbi:MAG: hypothetical protein JWN71_1870 [Xanthobacteraceae bacterium]|jgi:hypothetical protein|nr:hypothetical protein [Xanthobacteraceae bacterium]
MTDTHRERHSDLHPHTVTGNEARAGTGGQQTRYVMVVSTLGAAIAMAVVLIYLWNSWG